VQPAGHAHRSEDTDNRYFQHEMLLPSM
jgi:hypothetical protein